MAKISYKEWGAKLKSKSENYRFLTVEVGAYLPEYHCISVYFLKDLICGKKKCKYLHFYPHHF